MPGSPRFPAEQARSYKGIEGTTARVRRALGFGPREPVNAFETMCRLRKLQVVADGGKRLPVVYGAQPLEPGVEGETAYDEQRDRLEIILADDTYERLDDGDNEDPRARFSFFHELGHACLHYRELMRLSRIPKSKADALMRAVSPKVSDPYNVEWQANAFSASTMMPAVALEELRKAGMLNVNEVCRRFRVSRRSAEIRIGVFLKRRSELLAAKK